MKIYRSDFINKAAFTETRWKNFLREKFSLWFSFDSFVIILKVLKLLKMFFSFLLRFLVECDSKTFRAVYLDMKWSSSRDEKPSEACKVEDFSHEKLHFPIVHFSSVQNIFFLCSWCAFYAKMHIFLYVFHSQRAEMKNRNCKWTFEYIIAANDGFYLWRSFFCLALRTVNKNDKRKKKLSTKKKRSFMFNEMCR